MFHRLLALSLTIAVLALAGSSAITCAVGSESETCCCAPELTAAVVVTAPVRCDMACGTRPSPSPTRAPEIASSENPPALTPPASQRVAFAGTDAGSDLSVELESLAASVHQHDPPLLFVRNAAFLI